MRWHDLRDKGVHVDATASLLHEIGAKEGDWLLLKGTTGFRKPTYYATQIHTYEWGLDWEDEGPLHNHSVYKIALIKE